MSDLFKKYGVNRLSQQLSQTEDPGWERGEVVADDPTDLELANTEEKGRPNVHYVAGLPTGKDNSSDFGYYARGVRGDPGIFWQTYLADPLVKSTVDSTHEGLVSGEWSVELRPETPERLLERAEEQAAFVEAALLGKPDRWRDFLKAWTYGDRVYGFSLWEIVDTEEGGIKKLAYRRPGTVKKWIFSEDGRDWVGTEFSYMGSGDDVFIPAEDLLLYSTGIDLDVEGTSALRPIVRWVEIKQLITQIETAAAESHGNGYRVVESTDPTRGTDDDDLEEIKKLLAAASATDDPVFAFPGYRMDWIAPNGKLPDFQALRSYCDDQIALALQSTGSLVGLGDTGTYNLAEVKDTQENIRKIRFYGQSVCDLLNEHIVPRIIDNAFGGPVAPGMYPRLTFGLQIEAKDPQRYENIVKLAQIGALTLTRDDENQLREELDLSPLPEDESPEEPSDDPQGGEPVDPTEGDGDNADPQPVEASHTCRHTHDLPEETEAEAAIQLGDFKPRTPGITLANDLDPERLQKRLNAIENKAAKVARDEVRKFRDLFVSRSRDVTDRTELRQIARGLKEQFQPRIRDAIKPQIERVIKQGSASALYEVGVFNSLPRIKDEPTTPLVAIDRFATAEADRIADHLVNVNASYLEQNAVKELDPATGARKKPKIQSKSAVASTIAGYTGRSLNYGREQIIQKIKNEAEARGVSDTRIVAEYSSVMETNTCDPCKEADGRRVFHGSGVYRQMSPPNLCDGGERCRCIWSYILPSEAGYEQILGEVRSGYSRVDSGLGLSNSGPVLDEYFIQLFGDIGAGD